MKRLLEDAIAGDGAVFWAFGIAIATGLGFVYSAHAISDHFNMQECIQKGHFVEYCANMLEG